VILFILKLELPEMHHITAADKRQFKITIDYGYDIHSIKVSESVHDRIKKGEIVEIEGQGFSHEAEGECVDHWVFNRPPGFVYFWLDNGAEFYAGDSWVDEL
jgi:hypothetical protein